ncbi:MAG: bi-domain-containing oxidoreductase [Phycisphaerae bacterium]
MRQVVQNYSDGELRLEDVPAPIGRPGVLIVRTAYSLVSAGTERMKVEQARMSLWQKARARPDKVRQVVQGIRQNGFAETWKKVRERLSALTPLGYSAAGIVCEVGPGIDEFRVGDRVACAGETIACHAEFIAVPRNLCVRVPDGVDLKDAAFSTVGAIAINGVRQAGVALGDTVCVVGLGLIGLLAVQILKAAGCRVIGVDNSPARVQLARDCGADLAMLRDEPSIEAVIRDATGGRGPDAVYIAASANSSDPMEFAGRAVRDRGRIVVVGMVKIEADWRTLYMKEVSVLMARSYGPGRYDRNFESKGADYPVGYIPWTERRNLEEFLRLLEVGAIHCARLDPEVCRIDDAKQVYDDLREGKSGSATAMLFAYPDDAPPRRRVPVATGRGATAPAVGVIGVGLIGAGNFTTGTIIPALKSLTGVALRGVCSAGGLSATSVAQRHGATYATSVVDELLSDSEVHAVVIATRHDTHARFAARALLAGKHVYVEKPLALTREQLDEALLAQAASERVLAVGFNRRHSPLCVAVRDFFARRAGPLHVVIRVNAGPLGADSWYQDSEEGGWRIVSEGCHFVDLVSYFTDSTPLRVSGEMVGGATPGGQNDNCTTTLRMADGSVGVLSYVASGDPSFEKERIEVFGQGRVGVIDNFRAARLIADGKTRIVRPNGTGKGHAAALASFFESLRTPQRVGLLPDSAALTTLATFCAAEALVAGEPREVAGS